MAKTRGKAAAARSTRRKTKAKSEPAKRIAGAHQRSSKPTRSLVAFSESDASMKLSNEQAGDLLAWSQRVAKLAADDPRAYVRACRTGKHL